MSREILILQKFKSGLIQFLDEIIQWMPNDEELVSTRILVNDSIPTQEIMGKFIKHLAPFETKIAERDSDFFMKDPNVFKKVDEKENERILNLKKLWENPKFTNDDKEKTWKWLDFFIKCIKLYKSEQPTET